MDDDGRAAISPCFSSQMRRWPCEFRESLSAYRPVHFQPPSLNLPFVPTLNENSVAIQSSSAMKVTIKEWNAVATWRWDMPDDEVCGICRVQFDGTCPTCKFPGDDCSLLLGKCGHSFHMHCLMTWIQQESSKGLCPMCRQSMSLITIILLISIYFLQSLNIRAHKQSSVYRRSGHLTLSIRQQMIRAECGKSVVPQRYGKLACLPVASQLHPDMSLPKHTSPSPLSSSPSRQSVRRTSGSRPQSIIDRPGTAQQVTDIPEEHDSHEAAPAPAPVPQVHAPTEHDKPHDTTPTFQPFFTLIEDANSSEYHHPTVHYIFSDDDTDIVTEAALRALEAEPDLFAANGKGKSKPTQDHRHEADGGAQGTYPEDDEYAHQRKESLLPDPIPGVRDNYVILDIDYASPDGAQNDTTVPNTDGAASAHEAQGTGPPLAQQQQQSQNQPSAHKYTVTSAHSLSPAWQVLNTQLVSAPTFENNNSSGGQPPNGSLMLKIKGTAGLPMNMPGKDKDRERSSQRLEDMMDQFAKRLSELRQVIGAEEQVEDAEGEVEGDMAPPDEGDVEGSPVVNTEEPTEAQTHVEGGGENEGQSAES
ncbi:hypothetical protein M752DRAFT_251638 [Aspergillus phoenicis ATCC 13157]|uniref:Anaphase-promoting complex subunit 11 n=3 Tax=Aspergillus TaxID=5052 RepID=A0A370PJX8_ASPPH|nr:hypothetical protein M752DRAFT_251638 [Aspergillus phoenicis ATCC 13157]